MSVRLPVFRIRLKYLHWHMIILTPDYYLRYYHHPKFILLASYIKILWASYICHAPSFLVTNHVFPVPGIYFQTKKSLTQVSKLSSIETSFDHAPLLFSSYRSSYRSMCCLSPSEHLLHCTVVIWLYAGTSSHSSIHLIHPQHRAQY